MAKQRSQGCRRLLDSVVCPHCWTTFKPEETLCIAEAPDLLGDRNLTENDHVRFLPTEFDADGFAIDPQGYTCHEYACPHCHLRLPQSALEAPTLFMSIVGAPSTGKSYYLSSSTHKLRAVLPSKFLINFTDADSEMNQRLREFEGMQFDSGSKFVRLEKTDASAGDLYNQVKIGDQLITYPQPFVFTAQPAINHPNACKTESLARTVCLYDNSGESYLSARGVDVAQTPVTRHLAQSSCIFFLFDPTQDPRFRAECAKFSRDPQILDEDPNGPEELRRSKQRQEAVLSEMVRRVRSYLRLRNGERYKNPFIVIVAKMDVWRPLLPLDALNLISKRTYKDRAYNFLNMDRVDPLSASVRNMLSDKTPEFVAAAEAFASNVVYLPVSATGKSPTLDSKTRKTVFRSNEIDPIWSEIPMLYALTRTAPGLIPVLREAETANRHAAADAPRKTSSTIDLTKR